MNFETVVKRRRMCREFLERDVPQEKIDQDPGLSFSLSFCWAHRATGIHRGA